MIRERDWLDQATGELAAAETLRQGGHHAWACFTSQQAAEKGLKAVLEKHRVLREGHNLVDLVQRVAAILPVPDPVREAAYRLNKHYITPRYPDAHPSGAPIVQYSASEANQALVDAKEVLAFARNAL